ncbi:MAG: LPXTG cell wall anchor domain-containing protein [Chlamydiae bacterium]|nr:LPXTG cell wall anchor domain-containing protein [Chlamydiota bacterium]
MAVDLGLSDFTNSILSWFMSPLIWLAIIGVLLVISVGFLYIRKRKRLQFPACEIIDLGNGKTGFNILKTGWFGIALYFNGLWWKGREVMRTNAMEIIEEFSEEDFQEVNGRRGVIFYRDPINRKLFPISKLKVSNKEIIANIPPAEFVDAAISIVKEAEKETSDWREKVITWVVIGGVVIFALVSIIVITQMVGNGQDKASELIVNAGRTCMENARTICTEIAQGFAKTGGNAP